MRILVGNSFGRFSESFHGVLAVETILRRRPPLAGRTCGPSEGKWDVVYNNAQPGIPPNIPGTWVATKQADGRVLYDEFRLFGPNKETVSLCATFRVFDHVRKEWDMRYVGLTIPGPGEGERRVANWADLTAWREGSNIRVDQKGGEFWLRITYHDIGEDRFRWKADVSNDGGKTWRAEQIRIEAKRAMN